MRRFRFRRFRMNAVSVHAAILLLSGACIPYTVATTAKPVPKGESVPTAMITKMPAIGPFGLSFFSNAFSTGSTFLGKPRAGRPEI